MLDISPETLKLAEKAAERLETVKPLTEVELILWAERLAEASITQGEEV